MTLTDETRAFLAHLHRGGAYAYWWTVDGDRKTSIWWKTENQPPAPRVPVNVYFGVHPTTEVPTTNARGKEVKPQWARSRTEIIAAVNCLFAEFDAKVFTDGLDGALAAIRRVTPPASVIIASGGGYHGYWLLDEPWCLESAEAREQARQVQWAWVRYAGGDDGAKDLARVLRVPGTKNYKYQPPTDVAVVECDLSRVYRRDDLIRLVEPIWARSKLDMAVERVRQAPDGSKHNTLIKMSALGGGVAHILGEQTVASELYDAIEGRALDPRNAANTVRDGMAYGERYPLSLSKAQPVVPYTNGTAEASAQQPPAKSTIIAQALATLGYSFRINLCNDNIEVNGVPIDDILRAHIRTQMRDRGFKGMEAIEDVYTTIAASLAYHPIKDYFASLSYDGGRHIEKLAGCLFSSDEAVSYADGAIRPLPYVYLRRWLIGAVAKVMQGAQNLMLVFAGPQGIGKSELARWLCSGVSTYFIEAPINVSDKDSDVRLMSHFIWEVSELDATTRKADVSALKAFITKQTVSVRKAYGKHDTVKPALASFFGTVNDGSGFLTDETGNRRFLITNVETIDWSYVEMDVHQVWAEALHAYRGGEPWRLTSEEEGRQRQTNKLHEAESLLEGWVDMYFDITGDPDDVMTSAEIANHLRSKEIRLNGSERAQAMEISRILARLGVPKIRTDKWRGYGGIRPVLGE